MPYCIRCGNVHGNEDNVCNDCKGIRTGDGLYGVDNDGYRNNNYSRYGGYDQNFKQNRDYSVAGLTLGIVSFIMTWVPVIGVIVPILGLVLSVKSLKSQGRSKAVAGLVLSIVFLVIAAITNIFYLILFVNGFSYSEFFEYYEDYYNDYYYTAYVQFFNSTQ